jgi:hypothetical protein
MWENLADPIVTGHGEVGQPKLFAEIFDSQFTDGTYHCVASWMEFQFLEVRVREKFLPSGPPSWLHALEGTLMLKYVPRTGEWGEPEVCQVTCTPITTPDLTVEWRKPRKERLHSGEQGGQTYRRCITSLTHLPTYQSWQSAAPRSRALTAVSLVTTREY